MAREDLNEKLEQDVPLLSAIEDDSASETEMSTKEQITRPALHPAIYIAQVLQYIPSMKQSLTDDAVRGLL